MRMTCNNSLCNMTCVWFFVMMCMTRVVKFLYVGYPFSDCVCYRDQYYTMYLGSVCYRTCVWLNVFVCFLTECFFVSTKNRNSGLDLSDMFQTSRLCNMTCVWLVYFQCLLCLTVVFSVCYREQGPCAGSVRDVPGHQSAPPGQQGHPGLPHPPSPQVTRWQWFRCKNS